MEALRVPNSVSEMTRVFNSQITRGKFLSVHMTGRALDLGVNNLNEEQLGILKSAVESAGGKYLYENDPPHAHIQFGRQSGANTASADGSSAPSLETEDSSV